MDQFELMLEGGSEMDQHFASAPFEQNLPVLMGLIGVWNRNFLGMDSLACCRTDQRLHRFPAYLQQLEMESNGKRTTARRRAARRTTPARCCGASRARTRSIRSSSCCTRARPNVALDFSRR
jgi:glucose-6-phosphate isomerase